MAILIAADETDLVSAWQQALIQLDLCLKTDAYVLASASLPVRYAAVLTVNNALVDFVARFPNPSCWCTGRTLQFRGHVVAPITTITLLAVIDEVIDRAGTISTLVRLFWRIGCAGDGELTSSRGNDAETKDHIVRQMYISLLDVKRCWVSQRSLGMLALLRQIAIRGGKGVVGNDRSDIRNNPRLPMKMTATRRFRTTLTKRNGN